MSKKKRVLDSTNEVFIDDKSQVDPDVINLLNALDFYADQSDHRKAKQVTLDGGQVAKNALQEFYDAQ